MSLQQLPRLLTVLSACIEMLWTQLQQWCTQAMTNCHQRKARVLELGIQYVLERCKIHTGTFVLTV